MPRDQKSTRGPSVLSSLVGGVVGIAGAWIAYSNLFIDHELPLPRAIDADLHTLESRQAGMLSYYADTTASGRPLVLIHSINAAASAYEMRPLFQHYRGKRPVYALDLPGFGYSERADRTYSPALYIQAILDFLGDVVKSPADVVALSLGCEFAALAAVAAPSKITSLALISPSGFTARNEGRSSQRASQSGTSDFFYNLFSFSLWGRAFYDLIATKRSIYFFLKQSFEGPVDRGLAEYGYLSSHQPGAHHAPLYFISGKLFTPDVYERAYEKLKQPVIVLHDRDNFVRFDRLPGLLDDRPNWRAARIQPTLGLPQFEKLDATVEALDGFWAQVRLAQ